MNDDNNFKEIRNSIIDLGYIIVKKDKEIEALEAENTKLKEENKERHVSMTLKLLDEEKRAEAALKENEKLKLSDFENHLLKKELQNQFKRADASEGKIKKIVNHHRISDMALKELLNCPGYIDCGCKEDKE